MDLGCDIKKLVELFKHSEDESSSEDELPNTGLTKLGSTKYICIC